MNWGNADLLNRNRMQGFQLGQFQLFPEHAPQGFCFHPPYIRGNQLNRPNFNFSHQTRPTFYQQNGNFCNAYGRSAQDGFVRHGCSNVGTRDQMRSGSTAESHEMWTGNSKTDQGRNDTNSVLDLSAADATKNTLSTAISVGIQTDKRKTVSSSHVETQTSVSEIDNAQKSLTSVSTQTTRIATLRTLTQTAVQTEIYSASTDLCSNCRRTLNEPNLLSPAALAYHEQGNVERQRQEVCSSAEEAKSKACYTKDFHSTSNKKFADDHYRTCETYSHLSTDDSEERNVGQLLMSLQALTIPRKYNALLSVGKGEAKDICFPFQDSSQPTSDWMEQKDSDCTAFETKKASNFSSASTGHNIPTDVENISRNSNNPSSCTTKTDSQRTAHHRMPSVGSQNPRLKAKGLPPPLKFGGKRVFKNIEDVEQVAGNNFSKPSVMHASGMAGSYSPHVSKCNIKHETEGSNPSITTKSKSTVSEKSATGDLFCPDFHPCSTTNSNIPSAQNSAKQSLPSTDFSPCNKASNAIPSVQNNAEQSALSTDFHPCSTTSSNIPFVQNSAKQSILSTDFHPCSTTSSNIPSVQNNTEQSILSTDFHPCSTTSSNIPSFQNNDEQSIISTDFHPCSTTSSSIQSVQNSATQSILSTDFHPNSTTSSNIPSIQNSAKHSLLSTNFCPFNETRSTILFVQNNNAKQPLLSTDFYPCNTASSNIPSVQSSAKQSSNTPSLRSRDTNIQLQRVFRSLKSTSSRETGRVNSQESLRKSVRPYSSKARTPLKFSSKKVQKERKVTESSSDPSKWQTVASMTKRLKTDPANVRLKTYCSQEMRIHLRKTIQERHQLLTKREVESVLEMVISETNYLDGMQPSQILKGVDLVVERLDLNLDERRAEKGKFKVHTGKKDSSRHSGKSSEDEEKPGSVWSNFTSANPYTTLDVMGEKSSVLRQD